MKNIKNVLAKAKNYNLNVTEVRDSDFKNAFYGIFHFTVGILASTASDVGDLLLVQCSTDEKSFLKTRFWKLITGIWRRDRIGYRLRETDPQSFWSRFLLFHKVLLQCFLQALPAAGAWLIIGLIRVRFLSYQ